MTQIETPSYEVHVWRTVIVVLVAVLLATEVLERPGLWSSYARDDRPRGTGSCPREA